ncbi:MAG: extracellular solute-binding protein, partial [Rectinemataceae bacterium]|nr:extracellular solute-binding protein [Rectinemataceae bacterium]
MANIKDIAKLAGVSHGTVSNILNGNGNVSVEKIRLVEDVARKLGYSINAKAKMLRKGSTRSLAVILPDIINPHFASFFTGLKNYVESNDYTLQLYLTGDIPSHEEASLNMIAANRIDGIAVVTCLPGSIPVYDSMESNGIKIVFVERRPDRNARYIGFDYRFAGAEIMKTFIEKGFHRVGVISGLHIHSCEREFYEGCIKQANENREIHVEEVHVQSEKGMAFRAAFSFCKGAVSPEAIAASNMSLAEGVLSACTLGTFDSDPWMVSLAPLGVVSGENTIARYGLNSWMLGQETGKFLMDCMGDVGKEPEERILPCDGLGCIEPRRKVASKAKTLNILMLESPSASALMKLAPDFTQKTGIRVKFAIFPYNELYDVINQMGDKGIYDVIRLDMVWLPWLQRKCLMPLNSISRDHKKLLGQMLPGVIQDFSMVKGEAYAVPFDLSVQLLFYRKDLFEDPMVKR